MVDGFHTKGTHPLKGCVLLKGCVPFTFQAKETQTRNATGSESRESVESIELCKLYRQFGFIESDDCCQKWKIKKLTREQLKRDKWISARNELQHRILGLANSKCTDFKRKVSGRAMGHITI